MFDIASLDTATKADQGAAMEIVNPATGQVQRDSNGEPVTITLLGRNSDKVREAQRAIQNRRLESSKRGKAKVTVEDIEAEGVEILVAATTGWSFDSLAGEPFAFSEANARRFYADRRFRAIRDQADAFIGDDANFIAG